MTKPTKEEILTQPERYRVLDGGAVYDYEVGHIVAHTGEGPYQITKENSRIMAERRKTKYIKRHLRGLAIGAGIEITEDADDEEIENKSAHAVELMIAHTVRTYLKSENLRGMGETLTKLTQPFTQDQDKEDTPFEKVRGLVRDLAELGRQINTAQERQQVNNNVIDA